MPMNHPANQACRQVRNGALTIWITICAHAAQATTITVGPNGTYGSIQAGIAAALLAGGSNEIHVEAKATPYSENLSLTLNSGTITMIGGWNSTFTQRSLDPAATKISGGQAGRVLTATINDGKLSLSGFTLQDGSGADGYGGAIAAVVYDIGSLELRNSKVTSSTVTGIATANAFGGGIYAELHDTSALIIDGVDVSNNSVTQSANSWGADAGGVYLEVLNSANASISDSRIHDNLAAASNTAYARGGGMEIELGDSARVSLSRSNIIANSVSAHTANHFSYSGVFASVNCANACELDFTLDTFEQNHGLATQVGVALSGAGTPKAYLADVLISRGDGNGLQLSTDTGTANAVNLTIADNAGPGLYLSALSGSTLTAYNMIAFGNAGGDCSSIGTPVLDSSFCGMDPHFVDAANGDFHIQADSPARDAGAASPPGGLGLFDLDGNPRTFGPAPDIGAYEIGDEIFKDGFN